MATNQSATAQDITDELIAGMPEGFADLFDMQDPDGPGPLFTALGEVIAQTAIDRLDDLRDQLSPMTCNSATLQDWEAALALGDSRLARAGTPTQRRAQVIARLREWGAPTLDLIRRVVYSYLGYSSPADVVIRESDRDALRELHTYRWTGARTIGPAEIGLAVADGGTVGPGGAAVDICASIDELDNCTVTLTAPDSTAYTRVGVGRGAATSRRAWSAVSSGVAVGLNGAWGDGSSVWFVGGSGTILRWDGAAIVAETSGTANNLNAVWGDSGVVWAVGTLGVCLKRSGGTWSAVTTGTVQTLLGVWSKGSKVWACGAGGTIIYSDDSGATWSALTSGTAVTLRAIWGANAAQLWAVGNSGTILYSANGSTWDPQTSGTTEILLAVRGTSPWDVWVGGSSDTLLRYDATGAWAAVPSSTGATYRGVAPSGTVEDAVAWPLSTEVWACGTGGTLRSVERSGSYDAGAGLAVSMGAVWAVSPNEAWACGADGTIMHMLDTGAARVRVYFPETEGADIYGTWTVSVRAGGSGLLSQVALFVEGAGLDGWDGASGRGTAAGWWGVMFEPAKSAGGYDLDAARLAVARLSMACRWSNILRRSEGGGALAAGNYAALPGNTALSGAAVPGVG